jgi:Cu2+-exporting ATPase
MTTVRHVGQRGACCRVCALEDRHGHPDWAPQAGDPGQTVEEGRQPAAHRDHAEHRRGHEGRGRARGDHAGHEDMFRRRFWASTLLSVPVLVFS